MPLDIPLTILPGNDDLPLPAYQSAHAAAMDLHAAVTAPVTIEPSRMALVGCGFALAVLGACLLACRTFLRIVVLPLRAVGAMPLTAYTAQLVVWAVVASIVLGDPGDLSGFRALEPFWPLTLWTIVLCTAWALLIGRGPLEAAVDRISRWLVRDPAVGVAGTAAR